MFAILLYFHCFQDDCFLHCIRWWSKPGRKFSLFWFCCHNLKREETRLYLLFFSNCDHKQKSKHINCVFSHELMQWSFHYLDLMSFNLEYSSNSETFPERYSRVNWTLVHFTWPWLVLKLQYASYVIAYTYFNVFPTLSFLT